MNTELKKQEQEQELSTARQTNWRRPYYTVNGDKKAYSVEVHMPGVAKDGYNVSLQRDELLVEGRKVLPLPTGAKWLHREISAEGYKLRLQLNVDVDPEGISAKSENGILHISLPVAKEARPKTIQIS